ncbi:hypothetical protein Pmani_030272 [Petrolisthes manimaculis]|uniref:Uncharacterized protein n=1 Tax=Petrolisthes manimaculis TaxID=1843537 RepID=A0AAE1NXN7_9EUCA|nr:hypothetical protein Pmani_030272 [Petrolisthes manimaculis]
MERYDKKHRRKFDGDKWKKEAGRTSRVKECRKVSQRVQKSPAEIKKQAKKYRSVGRKTMQDVRLKGGEVCKKTSGRSRRMGAKELERVGYMEQQRGWMW